jgi:SAM-dependent methyltransferase
VDLLEEDLINPYNHWYYQNKFQIVYKQVQKINLNKIKVLDIGAGAGFFSKELCVSFENLESICCDINYASNTFDTEKKIQYKKNFSKKDLENSNLILLMDVLEHIDNDQNFLNKIIANAKPGTHVIITVPAFKSMWSPHDVALKHFRRYRLKEVESMAEKSGLEILYSKYIYNLVFPMAWIQRKALSKTKNRSFMKEHSFIVSWLLLHLCKLDNLIGNSRIFGLTVFLVAKVK